MWMILNLFGLRNIGVQISDIIYVEIMITLVLAVGGQGHPGIPRGFCSQCTLYRLDRTPEINRICYQTPNKKCAHQYLPNFIEEVIILVSDAIADVFTGLTVVFENDSNVHVDNDQKAHDQVSYEVGNSGSEIAAVTVFPNFSVGLFAIGEVKDGRQRSIPSSRGGHLEEEDEGLEEGFEVVDIVESRPDLGVLEQADAKDGKDEHDEEEEETDVHEGRQGHHQGEEQGPDSLRSLDQS